MHVEADVFAAFAVAGVFSRLNDRQTGHLLELAGVECCYGPAATEGSGGDDEIVRTNECARFGQLVPDTGVNLRHTSVQRHNFEPTKGFLQPAPTAPSPGFVVLSFEAKLEFGESDGADGCWFRWPAAQPRHQIEVLALVGDQQRSVEN
jgi:hypothetical protein